MRSVVSRRTSLIALAAACLAAAPASAETLIAHYSVKLVGLPLGTASLATSLDAGSYKVEANAKLSGIASMVSSSKGAATATGALAQGRVAPNSYATTAANAKTTRTIRMAMAAGAVKAAEITPPFEEAPGRILVTENHKRNIVDPLSALVMPVKGADPVTGPSACDRTIPVFDGWTRFDVALRYVGSRNVSTKGYSGPVAVCAARYTPVAGHRPDRPGTKFMAENKNMEVWLAPVGESRVVMPYRISVATMVGTTIIEAVEFSTGQPTKAALR